MRAIAPNTLLLDANILSFARSAGLSLPTPVGRELDRLAVPRAALIECLGAVSESHPRRAEYLRLVAEATVTDTTPPALASRAAVMVKRYARHGAALVDMLIAATAIEYSMTLVSTNWSDFHFVHGLWLLDARYLTGGDPRPGILQQAPPPTVGPVLPAPSCCKGLVDAGVLPRTPHQRN